MLIFTYAKRVLALAPLCLIIVFAAAQPPDPKSAAFDPARTIPAEALKEDLEVLWDILEEGHGGFERYTPAGALRKSFDTVRDGLGGPLTEFEFYTRLLPLVAGIKDGHTHLALSGPAFAWLDARPVFVPFGLRFLGGKAYFLRNLSPAQSVADGSGSLQAGRCRRLAVRRRGTRSVDPRRSHRRNIATGDMAFFLTWSPAGTRLKTLVAIEGHRWAIEDSFETTKTELGLDHNETRSWHGWHRHVSLVMLAFAMMAVIRHQANAVSLKKTMPRATNNRSSFAGRSRKSAASP